jgi:hypothetical protein
MNRQSKNFLLYVALLLLTHGMRVVVSGSDVIGYKTFLHYLIVLFPLIIVPLVFSIKIQTWQDFVVYLLVTIIVWQLAFVLEDWVEGRLSDPLWLSDREGTWSFELFRRCIIPTLLISVGALLGRLKRTSRLP